MLNLNPLTALSRLFPEEANIPLPPPSEIVSLAVYPIKSCRGFQVQSSILTRRGLELDRQWMFVDAKTRKFLTIREISSMTLVDTAVIASGDGDRNKEQLRISIHGTDKSVSIPARPSQEWLEHHTTLIQATIWGTDTDGYQYSSAVNSIFCDFFERDVALVYKGPTMRILRGNGAPKSLGRTEGMPPPLPLQTAVFITDTT